MAVEITELLSRQLELLTTIEINFSYLKDKAGECINQLGQLQKNLGTAGSIQGSNEETASDWSELLKDIYYVEDMIGIFVNRITLQSHKGFSMMHTSKHLMCWWNQLLLGHKIGELKDKVRKHMENEPRKSSSSFEVGLGQGQRPSSKGRGVRQQTYLEDKQAIIGESSTYREDVPVLLGFSLTDLVDVQVPLRKRSSDSDDKRLSPSENEEVENDAILPISSNDRYDQQWADVPNYFDEKPVIIILEDLVKKLAQPVLSRCMLQFLVSVALVAFPGKAILLWAVYNSVDIKHYFQCCAWVLVSEGSEATDILKAILEQVMNNEETERQASKSLQQMLHDFLVRKRYLIVLYGVRTTSLWSNLKYAFPFSLNGSRVILAVEDTNATRQSSSWIFGRDHSHDLRKMQQQLLERNGVADDTASLHASEEWPQSFAYLEDGSSIIGVKAAMSKLARSILSPDRLLFLISIVGVESFGKTSLLWKMYDAEDVKQHFECCAWVHVQEDFKEIDILAEIWKQISITEIKLPLEPMRQMLCNFLAQKRYLIVLCDVWTSSVWESLKRSLPNSLIGSRVILTVHEADVARQTNSWIFEMTPGRELLPDLNDLQEDALDRNVAQRWNSVSDIMDNESEMVGLKDKIDELAKLALNNYRLHFLISVIGVAGSGKTTLVKTFYNSIATKQHFKCRAWITVPQEIDERDLLVDLLGQLRKTKEKQGLSLQQLQGRLSLFLKWKRYLIVLDDVRTPGLWKNTLSPFLPNSSNGSRVILTIRKAYLAYHMNPQTIVLPLRPLNNDESWRLFSKKVHISADDKDIPTDLKEKILQGSRGLPLSIVLLGGLLSTSEKGQNCITWSQVIDKANQQASLETQRKEEKKAVADHVASGADQYMVQEAPSNAGQKEDQKRIVGYATTINTEENSLNALDVYYKDLTFPLNYCLLYLGLFPRSYEIPKRRLLLLWLAEGLIQSNGEGTTLEELAREHFEQLVSRNMVEIVKRSLDGSSKTCRLPSALYDALSPYAEKFGCFHIHRGSTTSNLSQCRIRRLAEGLKMLIHAKPAKHCLRNLRSYMLFGTRNGDTPADGVNDLLNKIVKEGVGMLVVLDLEGVYKPALSETLGKLPYLKYLGLRRTFLDSVPKSVGELPHLETLDVKHTSVITLPITIWKAKKLQHLYMSEIYVDVSVQKPFAGGSLSNLHTLWGLKIRGKIPERNQLNRLVDVRKLKLTCYEASMGVIDAWLSELKNLQSLKLRSVSEKHESSELPMESMRELQKLSKLYLFGKLTRPDILSELPENLTILTLSGSYLLEDPMETLSKLKKLKVLRLYAYSFSEKTMICHENGFRQLQVLKLWKLQELQHWTVEDNAMPFLKELEIRCCKKLEKVGGLEKLTTLTELTLTSMESSFVDYVKDIMGSNVSIEKTHPEAVSFKRIKNPGHNEVSK